MDRPRASDVLNTNRFYTWVLWVRARGPPGSGHPLLSSSKDEGTALVIDLRHQRYSVERLGQPTHDQWIGQPSCPRCQRAFFLYFSLSQAPQHAPCHPHGPGTFALGRSCLLLLEVGFAHHCHVHQMVTRARLVLVSPTCQPPGVFDLGCPGFERSPALGPARPLQLV